MKKKIISFKSDKRLLLDSAFKIRKEVFIDEQNCSLEEEFDGLDDECIHYLIFIDDIPAACSRRRLTEEGHKLERFAVLNKFRNNKLGLMLLEEMLKDTIPNKRNIYLHAQADVEGFYKKYGFERFGDLFVEANIDHYKMVYTQ